MTIHDHFDGISNCVECKGRCKLEDAEQSYSSLVRFVFEAGIVKKDGMIAYQLELDGVDIEKFRKRANQ